MSTFKTSDIQVGWTTSYTWPEGHSIVSGTTVPGNVVGVGKTYVDVHWDGDDTDERLHFSDRKEMDGVTFQPPIAPAEPAPEPAERNHVAVMTHLVSNAASAMQEVSEYWERNNLPGDFSTPETGFPFAQSLDEQVFAMWTWVEKLEAQAKAAANVPGTPS